MNITIEQAMARLAAELKANPQYYEVWKANLRSQFMNAYQNNAVNGLEGFVFCPLREDLLSISNQAADGFLSDLTL